MVEQEITSAIAHTAAAFSFLIKFSSDIGPYGQKSEEKLPPEYRRIYQEELDVTKGQYIVDNQWTNSQGYACQPLILILNGMNLLPRMDGQLFTVPATFSGDE
eukprot:scaffold336_cov196-Amphora_coffeaeformis.AAC.29